MAETNPSLVTRLERRMRVHHGRVEDIIEAIYLSVLRPGDTCVDGGANVGRHTVPMADAVRSEGRVFAFEPARAPLGELRRRTRGLRHVTVSIDALSDVDGRSCTFHEVVNLSEEGGLRRKSHYTYAPTFETHVVRTTTLDRELESVTSLRFVKLDLEGGEFDALRGARTTLRRTRPMLVFEAGHSAPRDYGYSLEEFGAFFDDLGYLLFDLLGAPLLASWERFDRPWYAIAVPAGSDDQRFIEEDLRGLLAGLEASWDEHAPAIRVHFGVPLRLAAPGSEIDATPAAATGMSWGEECGRWTDGTPATIDLRIGDWGRLRVVVDVAMAYLPPSRGHVLDVRVLVNGNVVDLWRFDPTHFRDVRKVFEVAAEPGRVGPLRPLELRFEIDAPSRPADAGVSEDARELGLHLRSIDVAPLV
ncbi:MAG: FkbM family methyltransferase [Polyangiaceae bacterium]